MTKMGKKKASILLAAILRRLSQKLCLNKGLVLAVHIQVNCSVQLSSTDFLDREKCAGLNWLHYCWHKFTQISQSWKCPASKNPENKLIYICMAAWKILRKNVFKNLFFHWTAQRSMSLTKARKGQKHWLFVLFCSLQMKQTTVNILCMSFSIFLFSLLCLGNFHFVLFCLGNFDLILFFWLIIKVKY